MGSPLQEEFCARGMSLITVVVADHPFEQGQFHPLLIVSDIQLPTTQPDSLFVKFEIIWKTLKSMPTWAWEGVEHANIGVLENYITHTVTGEGHKTRSIFKRRLSRVETKTTLMF